MEAIKIEKTQYLGMNDVKKIIAEYYNTEPSNVSIDFGVDCNFGDPWMEVVVEPFDITQYM